jgi:aspartyl-tRNA(Asn)/glutamyl-tRNA(Gln) amidotransferase subunit C
MSLSLKDVEHVAALARLGLTGEELETLREQLSSILGHIEVLNQLDTAAISPTAQVIAVENVMRDDAVRPSLGQDVVTGLAPRHEHGFIAVPAVLGGAEEETA